MLSLLILAPLVHAQDVLPVRRVRFYETGVAYFERAGTVGASTRLPVPRSHLDDALKTLVVLGGNTEVGAIRFPSSTSDRAARVLAGFDEAESQLPFEASLRAMQGYEVQIETVDGLSHTGLLMDISGPLPRPQSTQGDPTALITPEFALTQLASDGSLIRLDTTRLRAIKPVGEELTRRLEQAALSTGSGSARQARSLTVDLWESGPLALGYLAETPIWRVSYRVVLGDKTAGLQAWALVHNDTDEDWNQVRVELANGQPDSFLYPLATPRYAERELVTPEVDLSPVPQLATDTPDGMWDAGMTAIGMHGYGYGGGGSFGAKGAGGIGVVGGQAIALGAPHARLKEAEPVQTPTQFIYKVARPLDLPAQYSALVPLVQTEIPAEAVVAFPPTGGPRNGVWLTNATQRTLPTGVLSVFQAGGLSGESGLDRMKPDEHQMVLFGTELDLELARESLHAERQLVSLTLEDRLLRSVTEHPRTEQFTLTNRSGADRAVWLALEITVEEEITSEVREEIDPQRDWTWTEVLAPPGESVSSVSVVRTRTHDQAPWNIDEATWLAWSEDGVADRAMLRSAAALSAQLRELSRDQEGLRADLAERTAELERLREDLRAAGDASGSGTLTRRVASVESEIRRLQANRDKLNGRIGELQERFYTVLAPLSPEPLQTAAG